MLVTLTLVSTHISLFRTDGVRTSQQCVCIYTAVYGQTLTAISIFKYNNIVCIIQVHTLGHDAVCLDVAVSRWAGVVTRKGLPVALQFETTMPRLRPPFSHRFPALRSLRPVEQLLHVLSRFWDGAVDELFRNLGPVTVLTPVKRTRIKWSCGNDEYSM